MAPLQAASRDRGATMSRRPKAAQAAEQEEAAPDSAQVDDQGGELVTVPLVIPAAWRDELHSLAALPVTARLARRRAASPAAS